MFRKMNPRYLLMLREALPVMAACLLLALSTGSAFAQKSKPAATDTPKGDDAPCFSEYRGVQIGMSIDEARQKLGTPKEKADELDIYSYNDNETAQVYYDKKTNKVTAISVDYIGAASAPECRKVTGTEADARADGSKFKMIRYPKQGYWVSYNRTAGQSPIVTVTMQKMQ
jgi:hypothetical protein